MRILGVGVDLTYVARIQEVLERYPRFAERCFTPHERAYASKYAVPARRFAARFAGKEAVMKAMGTGWRGVRWRDIEITGGGKPTVRMAGTAADRARALGVADVLVSISHEENTAIVFAIAVSDVE